MSSCVPESAVSFCHAPYLFLLLSPSIAQKSCYLTTFTHKDNHNATLVLLGRENVEGDADAGWHFALDVDGDVLLESDGDDRFDGESRHTDDDIIAHRLGASTLCVPRSLLPVPRRGKRSGLSPSLTRVEAALMGLAIAKL